MKRLGFGLVASAMIALSTFAVPASAADLAYKAPVYPVSGYVSPAVNWTGFYIGVSGGKSWDDYNSVSTDTWSGTTLKSRVTNGWTYGGQVGYRYKTYSGIVAGLEMDLYGGGGKSTVTTDNCPQCWGYVSKTTNTLSKPFSGSSNVVLGYAAGKFMPYVKGGVAYAWVDDSSSTKTTYWGQSYDYSSKAGSPVLGWTVGAGLEYAFAPNLSVRGEYIYTDYRHSTFSDKYSTYNSNLKEQKVMVGVNFLMF